MNIYNKFTRFRSIGRFSHGSFYFKETFFFSKKVNGGPKNKLIRYQNQKLKELVEHAYTNVPYYNQIFNKRGLRPKDIQSIEDLNKLPVLTKEDVRKISQIKSLPKTYLTRKE